MSFFGHLIKTGMWLECTLFSRFNVNVLVGFIVSDIASLWNEYVMFFVVVFFFFFFFLFGTLYPISDQLITLNR